MSIAEKIDESMKELYKVVESFVVNEEVGLDAEAKQRNLEAMSAVVDGVRLMVGGLERMDRIILGALTESLVTTLMSNSGYIKEELKELMDVSANDRSSEQASSLWTAEEEMPEVEPEPKHEQKDED